MPRLEWKSNLGWGLRSAIARLSARRVTAVVLLRATVQPMMRREKIEQWDQAVIMFR